MYDIRDVLRKGIDIAIRKRTMFEKLREDAGDVRLRMQIGVFIKALDKDINYYEAIIKNISDPMAESIDYSVYDKISSLVNQFARLITPPKINDRTKLLLYVIEQEKAALALLLDIQGRMVTEKAIVGTISYYVLLEAIDDKRKRIDELERFMEK